MTTPFNEQKFLSLISFTHVLTKIFKILFIIAFSSTVLLFLIGIFLPSDFMVFDLAEVSVQFSAYITDNIRLSANDFEGFVSLKTILVFAGLFGAIGLAFVVYVTHQLEHVLKDIKATIPFSDDNVKRITLTSYAFIIASVLLPLLNVLFFHQITRNITQPEFQMDFSFNAGYLFAGLILYLLAKVFAYGGFLQHSYDETV